MDDEEAVARQVTGAVNVRDFEDEDEEGWYVKRPDDRADMAPLTRQLGRCIRRVSLTPVRPTGRSKWIHFDEVHPPASLLLVDQIRPCPSIGESTFETHHLQPTPVCQLKCDKAFCEAYLVSLQREHTLDNSDRRIFPVFYR